MDLLGITALYALAFMLAAWVVMWVLKEWYRRIKEK